MALTRLNNRSVSAVTALPSDITAQGSILQVVSAGPTVKASTSSTSWVLGNSVNITPSATTSKFVITLSGSIGSHRNGDQIHFAAYLERAIGASSTDITLGYTAYSNDEYNLMHHRYVNSSNAWYGCPYSITRYDTPNTTSQVTYKWFYKNYGSMDDVNIGGMYFTVMEIKA